MEGSFVHMCHGQDLVELLCEIVDNAAAGIGESPFTLGSQYLLDVVIPAQRNKDARIALGPSVLEIDQQQAYIFISEGEIDDPYP
jgi:hypothetical protein